MEDVKFVADSKKATKQGANFKGVKVFELKNDVLTIEMGDGRKFVSPLDKLQGTFHQDWRGDESNMRYRHEFELQNSEGEQLVIKFSDWDGFRTSKISHFSERTTELTCYDERRVQMFSIIESAPEVIESEKQKKDSKRNLILLIFWIIVGILSLLWYFDVI